MEHLFPRKNISFDYDHGVYYPTVCGHRQVQVECADKTLLHWTMNALNRHGYQCITHECDTKLLALSPTELHWTEHGTTRICHSFEELLG
jgi:iron complex transport system ATP-binding protein